MSDNIVNLAEARAVAAEDSRLWTPLDCIRALLRDMESGEVDADAILVHWYQKTEDGGRVLRQTNANLNRPEAIAMIVLAQDKAVRDWINP